MTGRPFGHRKWGKGSKAERNRVGIPPCFQVHHLLDSLTYRDKGNREEGIEREEGNLSEPVLDER